MSRNVICQPLTEGKIKVISLLACYLLVQIQYDDKALNTNVFKYRVQYSRKPRLTPEMESFHRSEKMVNVVYYHSQ